MCLFIIVLWSKINCHFWCALYMAPGVKWVNRHTVHEPTQLMKFPCTPCVYQTVRNFSRLHAHNSLTLLYFGTVYRYEST